MIASARWFAPLASVLLLLAACSSHGAHTIVVNGYPPVSTKDLAGALGALCDVERSAAAHDVAAARLAFFDRSHVALHVIAGATAAKDRAVAAGLLVAKQRVESDLAASSAPASLAADVTALIAAANDAAAKIGVDRARCAS